MYVRPKSAWKKSRYCIMSNSYQENDSIEDKRRQNFFIIDNAILDVYGANLGPYGIAVYSVIVRHANANGNGSFPSFKRIAELSGMGRTKAVQSINLLVDLELISKKPRFSDAGAQTSNTYTLNPVSHSEPPVSHSEPPPFVRRTPPVREAATKKTQLRKHNEEETALSSSPIGSNSNSNTSLLGFKKESDAPEDIIEARRMGVDAAALTAIVDAVLAATGSTAIASDPDDRFTLRDARAAAMMFVRNGKVTPSAVTSVKAHWDEINCWRWASLPNPISPTFRQLKEQLSNDIEAEADAMAAPPKVRVLPREAPSPFDFQ